MYLFVFLFGYMIKNRYFYLCWTIWIPSFSFFCHSLEIENEKHIINLCSCWNFWLSFLLLYSFQRFLHCFHHHRIYINIYNNNTFIIVFSFSAFLSLKSFLSFFLSFYISHYIIIYFTKLCIFIIFFLIYFSFRFPQKYLLLLF